MDPVSPTRVYGVSAWESRANTMTHPSHRISLIFPSRIAAAASSIKTELGAGKGDFRTLRHQTAQVTRDPDLGKISPTATVPRYLSCLWRTPEPDDKVHPKCLSYSPYSTVSEPESMIAGVELISVVNDPIVIYLTRQCSRWDRPRIDTGAPVSHAHRHFLRLARERCKVHFYWFPKEIRRYSEPFSWTS